MAELYKSVTELMKTARGNKALQGNLGDITDFQQIIDDTPTADVVEVVHCADCKHLVVYDNCCMYFGHKTNDDDFCSCGERRTDNAG